MKRTTKAGTTRAVRLGPWRWLVGAEPEDVGGDGQAPRAQAVADYARMMAKRKACNRRRNRERRAHHKKLRAQGRGIGSTTGGRWGASRRRGGTRSWQRGG